MFLCHKIFLLVLDKYWMWLRLYAIWKFFIETVSRLEEADMNKHFGPLLPSNTFNQLRFKAICLFMFSCNPQA